MKEFEKAMVAVVGSIREVEVEKVPVQVKQMLSAKRSLQP